MKPIITLTWHSDEQMKEWLLATNTGKPFNSAEAKLKQQKKKRLSCYS